MKIISSDDGLQLITVGLQETAGHEICASIDDTNLREECHKFLAFVANYIQSGHRIQPGGTLGYGYWITKGIEDNLGNLCFWEYEPEAVNYVPGISNTLRYWRDQHQVCAMATSIYDPPNAEQLIVISEGVFERDDVQGVRYPSPNHMSGWWITTDRYDGNVSSLKTVHAYHLTAKRPDLAKFIALTYGYRFYSDNGEVRFDPKVIEGNGKQVQF